MENKLFTVEEALAKNGGPIPLSKSGLYRALAEGQIKKVNIGRRVFIPSWFINELINKGASDCNK